MSPSQIFFDRMNFLISVINDLEFESDSVGFLDLIKAVSKILETIRGEPDCLFFLEQCESISDVCWNWFLNLFSSKDLIENFAKDIALYFCFIDEIFIVLAQYLSIRPDILMPDFEFERFESK